MKWPLPDSYKLREEDGGWYVETETAQRVFPTEHQMIGAIHQETGLVNFHILYVGQAFGQDGSRNAVERLRKHATLQEIALKGIPEGYGLNLLLFEIQPSNSVVTMFNPRAEIRDQGDERIRYGLDKLFGTSERERITLYEASLIRYFQPICNIQFKDSFPSTNMKLLKDCYEKDFSAIVAEINFDRLPFSLASDVVVPARIHTVVFDLHDDERRKVFFSPSRDVLQS